MRKPKVKKERPPRPPKPPPPPKKVFVEDTILSLWREDGKNYSEEVRIVVWVIDGKRTSPRLERREKTFDEDTKRVKRSKAKGLLLADVDLIFANVQKIAEAFANEMIKPQKEETPPLTPKTAITNGHIADSPFI